jgi:hypothetical protein
MAYRLDKAVIRGEISNTTPDQVTGQIWLVGLKNPLTISLEGNCLRDLAGCTLSFVNPHPRPERDVDGLCPLQEGQTGEMTASRKVRVPLIHEDELMEYIQEKKAVPSRLANSLYLEWFSTKNGRVVVEGTDFQLTISEPAWGMTAEAEKEQIVRSQETFYQFLNDMVGSDLQNQEDEEDFDDEEEDEDEDAEENELGSFGFDTFTAEEDEDDPLLTDTTVIPPFASNDTTIERLSKGANTDEAWEEFLARVSESTPKSRADATLDRNKDTENAETPAEEEGIRAFIEDTNNILDPDMMGDLEDLEDDEPLNEFEWEQEFRAADRKAAAYQEAFDRYRHHPDREKLIAEAMGWEFQDIDELPGEWEDFTKAFTDANATVEGEEDPIKRVLDGEEQMEPSHPLSRRAMRFALKLQEDAESMGLVTDRERRDHPLLSVIVSVISVGGKLAAALDGVAMGYDPDHGFIIAMLKRAQIPLNEALHALSCIEQSTMPKDAQMWIATVRSELFDLRKDVLDIMQEMREAS